MSNCPPAPSYIRTQGIADCDYLQMTPFQRQTLRNENLAQRPFSDLLRNHPYPHAYYKIGGYPMSSLGFYRKAPPSIGRSKLPMSTAKSWNLSHTPDIATLSSPYTGYDDPKFINDVWTAQLLAFWLSNGRVYVQYPSMAGAVSSRDYTPSDISPLNIDGNGHARVDVRDLLNPQGDSNERYIEGPDGMFGTSGDHMVAEWVRTGKLYSYDVPSANEKKP